LFRRGARTIVLDLAGVSNIDAAGISELVRTYNMAMHASGAVQIVHANAWVRQTLKQAGLFDILSGVSDAASPRPFNHFLTQPLKGCLDHGVLSGGDVVWRPDAVGVRLGDPSEPFAVQVQLRSQQGVSRKTNRQRC
jgi:hypothetical protein